MRWFGLALLLTCQSAWGWYLDAGRLYAVCTSGGAADAAGCEGYIIGVLDSADTGGTDLCLPQGRPASDIVDLVIAYLAQHPEHNERAAASVVRYALVTAFACP